MSGEVQVVVRVSRETRRRWRALALGREYTLTRWITEIVEREAERQMGVLEQQRAKLSERIV